MIVFGMMLNSDALIISSIHIPKVKTLTHSVAYNSFLEYAAGEFGGWTIPYDTLGKWNGEYDICTVVKVAIPPTAFAWNALKAQVAILAAGLQEKCVFTELGDAIAIMVWAAFPFPLPISTKHELRSESVMVQA